MIKSVLFIFIFFIISGCTHGHCNKSKTAPNKAVTKVWVYKYDQSKQCQEKSGLELTSMAKDFDDLKINVYDSKKSYDGLSRMQVCGAFTGMANLFLIDISNLEKAGSRGYLKWDF